MMKSAKQTIFTGINGLLVIIFLVINVYLGLGYFIIFIIAEYFNEFHLWNDIEKGS